MFNRGRFPGISFLRKALDAETHLAGDGLLRKLDRDPVVVIIPDALDAVVVRVVDCLAHARDALDEERSRYVLGRQDEHPRVKSPG